MQRLHLICTTLAVAVACMTLSAHASARTRTLTTLISIANKSVHDGLAWSVLGTHYQRLGTAIDVVSKRGTIWKFKFVFRHGTLRTTWHFTHGRHRRLLGAPIVGGTGTFAGATGNAAVHGLTPSGTLTSSLDGVPYVEVVFHWA